MSDSVMDNAEVRYILDKVAHAKRHAGTAPWLYGYDVVGIQQFIGARNRPVAMRGASEAIRAVDHGHGKAAGAIFAGGGRGIGLAKDRKDADERCEQLATLHRRAGGVLATASIPFDAAHEKDCLRWLRSRLVIAKDEAPSPPGGVPTNKAEQCANCALFRAEVDIHRGTDSQRVCRVCAETVRLGGSDPQMRQSLAELSPNGVIAAVSADGNGMGRLFDGIDTMEQYAVASAVISRIFTGADSAAGQNLQHKRVPLITGGDDIRVFLAVEDLLPYITSLVEHIHGQAERAAAALHPVLPPHAIERLQAVGVGMGVVVSDERYPASRLLDYAHWLEDSAKSICQSSTEAPHAAVRSALDLEVLTDQDRLIEGLPRRSSSDGRPFPLEKPSWDATLKTAQALRNVPSAQIAALAGEPAMDADERRLHFRYQVARSEEWQQFVEDSRGNWREGASLDARYPGPGLIQLYRVLSRQGARA